MTDREFRKYLQEKLKQKMREEVQAERKPPESEGKLKVRRSKAG
jgi:hypothetical protein